MCVLQIPVDDFHFLTRIHYKSNNVPDDGRWGEHEIDYILFIQRDVNLKPNCNEVKSHRYVTKDELKGLVGKSTSVNFGFEFMMWKILKCTY